MSNRIVEIHLENRSLDPVSAEVWVYVRPETLTPTTEVRGRLMGPSCPYSSTVEIAYPLRPLRQPEPPAGMLRCRVAIPEASLWDVQSPFLYSGPVELWEDGTCVDRSVVRHGLRRVSIGPAGLRLNGKPFTLSGRVAEHLTQEQALELHNQGCNLLLTSGGDEELWDLADRLGFLILLQNWDEPARQRTTRPSWFGQLGIGLVHVAGIDVPARREGDVLILGGTGELGQVLLTGSA